MGGGRRQMELMNALLMSMPGTPIIYYGDEIGMGDNIYLGDRNGVRTPMLWSADRKAGFSEGVAAALFSPVISDPPYGYQAVNVEAQNRSSSSLLSWMKRLIRIVKQHPTFRRGTFEILHPANQKVFAFIRQYGEETLLAAHNLSRFAQAVELDLKQFAGRVPVELFGNARFPQIGELPYLLTFGPHNFFWFRLDRPLGATS
jgi:maltose alpha-D-glucosyltransferase/alpha-amylase